MKSPQTTTSAPQPLEQKYNTARLNLLLMIGLTAVNLVLLFTGSDVMMLFSATVPYIAAVFAVSPGWNAFFPFFIGVAVVIILLYLVCWFFSKKHPAWMIVALVMFVLDTLAMVALYVSAGDTSGIMDILLHIYVLYYLISGTINGFKLRNESKQPIEPIDVVAPVLPDDPSTAPQSYEPTDLT